MSWEASAFLEAEEPLPFEHLFYPLVAHARKILRQQTGLVACGLVTDSGHGGFERCLLARLTAAGAKAAHWQFQVYKTVRATFTDEQVAVRSEADALYRAFVDQTTERLRTLFDEFPTLAELCSVLVRNWLSAVTELLHRLETDRHELSARFKAQHFDFPIVAVDAGLSDPHRGGRSVVRLQFKNGTRLIYKPRSLGPEALFVSWIDWLNTGETPYSLRSVHCWDRGDYGWMENIDHSLCETRADGCAFYWRAGALLGLTYLVRGVDFHRENLIAAGAFPLLIDLEALWHTQKPGGDRPADSIDSVLRTGFLPQGDPQLALYERSALSRQILSTRTSSVWNHVNRDAMILETKRRPILTRNHLPASADAICLGSDFVPEVRAGFQWVGEKLLGTAEGRETLESWVRALVFCPRRLILGLTSHYQNAIDRLTLPRALRKPRSPTDSSIEFSPSNRPKAAQENRALEQMDIPYFVQDTPSATTQTACFPTLENYLAQVAVIAASLAGDSS